MNVYMFKKSCFQTCRDKNMGVYAAVGVSKFSYRQFTLSKSFLLILVLFTQISHCLLMNLQV